MSLEDFLVAQIRSAVRDEIAAALGPLRAEIKQMRPSRYGSRAEAAKVARCSLPTIDRGIERGDIACKKVGRRVLVDLDSLRVPDGSQIAEMAGRARLGLLPTDNETVAGR